MNRSDYGDISWCALCAHLFAVYDAAPDRESAARALARFDTHRDEGHPRGNPAGRGLR